MAPSATALAEKELLARDTAAGCVGLGRRRAHRAYVRCNCFQFGRRQTERRHARSGNAIADHTPQLVERSRAHPAAVRQIGSAFGPVAIAMAYRAAFREHG